MRSQKRRRSRLYPRSPLVRLARRAGNPDYNLTIHDASRGRQRAMDACWFVRIRPRITEPGGFEYASGMAVNPSLPDVEAATLRGTENWPTPAV